ncbi:MAG: hypothetical protein SVC26_09740, partial [Pseudomonadota bacterium]|nr:hypothetical protein [Pseudomonadota bacterium]
KILVPAMVALVCLSAQFAWQQSLTPEQLLDATQTNVERTHKWPEKKQVGSLDVESVNGFFGSVGARASHNAFPEFTGHSRLDSVENPLLTRPMQFLEIRLETGWFGLVLSALMVFYLIYISRQSVENGYLGWLFAALIMLFPLNAHTAFYGSYWSSALWILLSLQLVVCAQAAQSKVAEAGSAANVNARKQAS